MTSSEELDHGAVQRRPQPFQEEPPRGFSRSPHPYHRRSISLHEPANDLDRPQIYETNLDSTESEERATEADDEKGPLKGLPAPPLRGRKGLRGSKTPIDETPAISPLPTPSWVEDNPSSYFNASKKIENTQETAKLSKHGQDAYSRYTQRKQAEIVRRWTESVLLTLIGVVSYNHPYHSGRMENLASSSYSSFITVACLCLLFPLRTALRLYQGQRGFMAAIFTGFRIPSKFDPGPLLYPVFLPVFLAVSIDRQNAALIATNLVLGISSLPSEIIPLSPSLAAGYLHWALSLAPIVSYTLEGIASSQRRSARAPEPPFKASGDLEIMVLLFPLHQAILSTLKFLTSTSLDPAELQLLSTGLINIYQFSSSPQAQILKGLLWLGSLCLLVLCRVPLGWEVALARIPNWKFARNKSPKNGLLSITDEALRIVLPQSKNKQSGYLDSDDEDYDYLKSARRNVRARKLLRKVNSTQSDFEQSNLENNKTFPASNINALQRSATLSTHSHSRSQATLKARTAPKLSGLASLTFIQAQALKWLISIYTFLVVVSIVLLVIRPFVSTNALSGCEPFGWAIGYLFGNLPKVRFWIVSNNLEKWICLPNHMAQELSSGSWGWIENIRQLRIGPANTRLGLMAYCLLILTVGIGIVLRLRSMVEVDTRRKVFHGIMVAMLLPTIFIDPCFIALALSLILAIFLLLDLFRASQLPPISKPLTNFLAPYVDGRDHRGPVIVSHIFLLIGCAIPLWLSLAGIPRTGKGAWQGWDTDVRDLSMVSGVICVGLGDAAASLIGRRYGKTKWFWGGGKSLEGSFAFALAVASGLMASYIWLRFGGWAEWHVEAIPAAVCKAAIAGVGASLLETVLTAGNDNVIVPVGLWLLVRGLRL